MDVDMILKQKDNKNKIIKKGLMGVYSNYHAHENNQVYEISSTKMITNSGLIPNLDHEILKKKTQQM